MADVEDVEQAVRQRDASPLGTRPLPPRQKLGAPQDLVRGAHGSRSSRTAATSSSLVLVAVEIEKALIRRGRLYGEPASD